MTLEEFYETDWFKERPEVVKELFKQFPVNKEYYLRVGGDSKESVYGVWVIGFESPDDEKTWTARIQRDDVLGVISHQVFGIQTTDLLTKEQVEEQNLNISWHSRSPLNIT